MTRVPAGRPGYRMSRCRAEPRSCRSCASRCSLRSSHRPADKVETGSIVAVSGYVHGYATKEQQRLVRQAEHWRGRLIRDGTRLEPGRDCSRSAAAWRSGAGGPGAGVPGYGVARRRHRARSGSSWRRVQLERKRAIEATLLEARRVVAPVRGRVVRPRLDDVVPRARSRSAGGTREARRMLVSDGAITAIEVDYATTRAEPSTPTLDAALWCGCQEAWLPQAGATPVRTCRDGCAMRVSRCR